MDSVKSKRIRLIKNIKMLIDFKKMKISWSFDDDDSPTAYDISENFNDSSK